MIPDCAGSTGPMGGQGIAGTPGTSYHTNSAVMFGKLSRAGHQLYSCLPHSSADTHHSVSHLARLFFSPQEPQGQ